MPTPNALPTWVTSGPLQSSGCDVRFVAEGGTLRIQRTNELGTTTEDVAPVVLAWVAGVLNAALKWRTTQGSSYLNAKASGRQALMKALTEDPRP